MRALLLLMCCAVLPAQDIERVEIGLAGCLAHDRPTPVHVLLRNPGATTWTGLVELEQIGLLTTSEHVRAMVAVSPGGRRWVELPCWSGPHAPRLRLSCRGLDGGLTAQQTVEDLRLGPPADLLLRPPVPLHRLNLPLVEEERFPATVGLCDGLRRLVLMHEPQWNPAQRRAFLDWLHAGGEVDLLPDAAGRRLAFAAPWPEELRAGIAAGRYGRGAIRHHQGPAGIAAVTINTEENSHQPAFAQTVAGAWYPQLRALCRPDLSWGLIAVLLFLYILAIFPGCWLLGRRVDYRLALLALIGLSALCAIAVGWIGRRGYGESQQFHSLTVARQLADGRTDVAQWAGLFVTDGDVYTLAAEGDGLLALGADSERASPLQHVLGEDELRLPVALFSTETLHRRWTACGEQRAVRLTKWQRDADGCLQKAELVPEGFRPGQQATSALLIDGDQIVELDWVGDRWRKVMAGRTPLRAFTLTPDHEHMVYQHYPTHGVHIDADRARSSLLSWLGVGSQAAQVAPLPRSAPGSLRLLYLDTTDPAFRPAGWRDQGQHAVLWDLCVDEPDQASIPTVQGPEP